MSSCRTEWKFPFLSPIRTVRPSLRVLLQTTGTATSLTAPLLTVAAVQQCLPTEDPLALPLPVTQWWKSTSAEALARITRSLSQWQTLCPSQDQSMTTLPKHWGIHGFRLKLRRTECRAVPSLLHGGASLPHPPTWSIIITRPLWSHEERTVTFVNLHGLTELWTVLKIVLGEGRLVFNTCFVYSLFICKRVPLKMIAGTIS